MYRLSFILLFLCIFFQGKSAPISSEEAIKIAANFYSSQHIPTALAKSASPKSPTLTLAYACRPQTAKTRSASPNEAAYYYVVNIGKGDGYIIVAGDDRAKQVLGYCYQGEFDTDNISPALTGWLEGYEREIKVLMSTEETTLSAQQESTYPPTVIAPLVQTKWNQGNPYNRHCPMTVDQNSGQTLRSVVGCTAIGLVQIMKYHEWPAHPTGNIQYGDRSMDFDIQPDFDWANMLNEYNTNGFTETEADAVARLCACGAYACKMNFSPTSSGSYPIDAGIALSQYFGYEPAYIYNSNYHSQKEWVDFIMKELENKRPILYSGFNNHGGHIFVCDGYDGKGYFHFNWGWAGNSDGYYSLTALDPSYEGIGSSEGSYTFSQLMICHIQRPGDPTFVPQEKKVYLSSDLTLSYQKNENETIKGTNITAPRTSDISINFWYDRESTTNFYTAIVLGYMENGVLHKLTGTYYALCTPRPSDYNKIFTINTANLPTGKYELGWYQHSTATQEELLASENWTRMTAANGEADAIELTIGEEEQCLQLIQKDFRIALSKDLEIGKYYAGEQKTILLPIKNVGEVRLEGRLGFKIQKAGSTEATFTSTLAYCFPQTESTVPLLLNIQDAQVGDQYIVTPVYGAKNSISQELNEDNSIALCEPQNITITRKPSISGWAPNNANFVLDGTNKTIAITINQGSKLNPWSGKIYGKVYKQADNGEYEDTGIETWSDELDFPNRETRTINLQANDIDNLPSEGTYKLIAYINDGYGSDGYGTGLVEAPLLLLNMPTSIQQTLFTENDKMSIFHLDGTCIAKDVDRHTFPALGAGIYIIKVKTASAVTTKKIIIK